MGEVIKHKTPTGGDSSLAVEVKGNSVQIVVRRVLLGGAVKSETVMGVSPAQARLLARAMLEAADTAQGVTPP